MSSSIQQYIKEETKDGLSIFNFVLTIAGVIAFIVLLVVACFQSTTLALKILIVCTISFVLVTIIRKVLNVPRPEGYEKKRGESFPSRHTFSMMMIGLAWINVNMMVGLIICGLAMVLGAVRITIGAHRPIDIYGSILIAITCAYIGFIVI